MIWACAIEVSKCVCQLMKVIEFIVDKAMGAGSRLRRTWMDLKVLNLVEKMTCNNIKWNKRIHQATPKFCCKRFVDVGVALLRVLLIITSDTFSEHMDYAPFFLGGKVQGAGWWVVYPELLSQLEIT